MCGIAGIYDSERYPRPVELASMVAIQQHRGPDADGSFVSGCIALGMRRLAIIDLAGGDQPIFNEDGTIAIVFNGEIYNYREIREELLKRGHRFRSSGDTEVLVHLYEEKGTEMLPLLNGMFAFALWDDRRRRLLLARDRMGVKPLYYTQSGTRWLFASELKCLMTQPEVRNRAELDPDALTDFLRLSYIPRQATPYRNIYKLLPGHYLTVSCSGLQIRRWWDLAERPPELLFTEADRKRELGLLFEDAVQLRMRSDVPVASFLSGGLDSSLVTIFAQRHAPAPINSFTLNFEHPEFDETPYALDVAVRARTRHRVKQAGTQDAISLLPLLLWHMDEPMGDSSIIPNFLISQFAAEYVKVCLSGLGGDEVFGGYSRYLDPGKGRIRRLFTPFPAAAGWLAPRLEPWHYGWAEELRIASGPETSWRHYLNRLQVFNTNSLRAAGWSAHGRTESIIEDLWKTYPGRDGVSRRQFIDMHTYLPDQILALTDRMSMANALEVRVPFMDYRLVRFGQALPAARKQTAADFKIFLKDALGENCPPSILTRPKWGFDTPLRNWLAQPGLLRYLRHLPAGECARLGWFDPQALRAMTASPEAARDAGRRLWNVFILELWLRVRHRLTPPRESVTEILEDAPCAIL